MPATRSSSRATGSSQPSSDPVNFSPPKSTNGNGAGQKRKADTTPAQPKNTGRKPGRTKKQKTIEETMPGDGDESKAEDESEVRNGGLDDEDMKDAAEDAEVEQKEKKEADGKKADESQVPASSTNGVRDKTKDEDPTAEVAAEGDGDLEATDKTKREDQPEGSGEKLPHPDESEIHNSGPEGGKKDTSKMDDTGEVEQTKDSKTDEIPKKAETSNGALEESKERSDNQSSNVLEKGIIYFFLRGRVGLDDVEGVQDIARTYIVLRPLPSGAKLGDGAIQDLKNNRLLALPKKVLPKSGRDQFMTFVEKAGTTIEDLKENFMQGSSYDTKTTGVRHSPAVTPVGEGVYAITTTGRESHLAYMLTIPSELGEVQKELGLCERGSFVTSLKNPAHKGPAYANLPQGAEFSDKIKEEFRGLRWMPMQPKHLEYVNAQVLLIGESQGELDKAVEPAEKDAKHGKETPVEAMETLEEEDAQRVEGLKGEEAEAVFADLGISRDEYPKLMTTW